MSSRQFKNTLYYSLLVSIPITIASCESQVEPQAADAGSKQPVTAAVSGPVTREDTGGFHLLFDGQTLAGWHGYAGVDASQRWQAEQGVLSIREDSSGHADLVSDRVFENFELILEWKISPAGNSGIMFNVAESSEYSTPWKTGPELQILDNDGHADSSPTHRAGDLYDLLESRQDMARPVGEWNESRLLIEDGLLRHWLNGALIIEVQMWNEAWNGLVANSKFGSMPGFGKYQSGHIALQDHGDVVSFRNIRIREL